LHEKCFSADADIIEFFVNSYDLNSNVFSSAASGRI